MRAIRRTASGLCVVLLAALVACVPTETSGLHEVDDGSDSAASTGVAPTFPDIGNVSADLVVEGLVHDFFTRPADQRYWSPSAEESECAARRIVESMGPERIVGLGYRPGVPGASLNDVELTDAERTQVIDAFESCVDMVEGFASILYAAGRMPTRVATCVARGMGQADQLTPIIEGWAFGRAVDPFDSDSAFATTLLGYAEVCIPETAFNWPHLRLPERDPIIDSDAPGGQSNSPYVDDVRRAASEGAAAPTAPAPTAPVSPP